MADPLGSGGEKTPWSRPLKGVLTPWSSCWPGPSPPTALQKGWAPLPWPRRARARGDSGGTSGSWGMTPRSSGGTSQERLGVGGPSTKQEDQSLPAAEGQGSAPRPSVSAPRPRVRGQPPRPRVGVSPPGRGSGVSPQAKGSGCSSLCSRTGGSWCLWSAGRSSCGQGSLRLISDPASMAPRGLL